MRSTWLAALAVFLGLGLLVSSGFAQGDKPEQGQGQDVLRFKQVQLTETDMRRFIAAQKQLAPLSSRLEAAGGQADPALQKEVEQIAKGTGFSNVEELGNITANVSLVLAGLDTQT